VPSVLVALLSSGCASSVNVTATRFSGVVMDSLMTVTVGDIRGPDGDLFREELHEMLVSSEAFDVRDAVVPFDTTMDAGQFLAHLSISGEYQSGVDVSTVTRDVDGQQQDFRESRFYIVFDHEIHDMISGDLVIDGSLEESTTESERIETENTESQSLFEAIADLVVEDIVEGIVLDLFAAEKYSRLRNNLMRRFIHEISPHRLTVELTFFEDGDLPELEQGIGSARVQKWKEAIQVFERVIDRYPGHPELHKAYFDLGVAYEYDLQFELAWQNLQMAFQLKDDDEYERELQACRRFEQEHLWRQRYLGRIEALRAARDDH
jgi:hypothetical protein